MKVYSSITFDIESGSTLESISEEYIGPVALCGDMGLGTTDMAAGVDPGADQGAAAEPTDVVDAVDILGDEGGDDAPADEGEPDAEDGGDTEADAAKAVEGKDAKTDVMPAALSKALRELKAAHPEQAPVLKELSKGYYDSKAYREVYASPDEARADKAIIEAIGGHDGLNAMRSEIAGMQQFDRMAAEGNPRVIEGLASEFPDGFKRLVPHAVQMLAKSDPAAYTETMRGPLLQELEGSGLIDAIGDALEELKAGDSTRAQRHLGRIAAWYQGLKKQEGEAQTRAADPRLKELETREQQFRGEQATAQRNNVVSSLTGYLDQTLKPGINTVLQGKTLPAGGRARFEQNVRQEVNNILSANTHYRNSIKDLIDSGKTDQAVNFAKPFIDAARRKAINSVYTDLYGNAPAAPPKKVAAKPATNGTTRQEASSDKPQPISRKPASGEIDWSRDPRNLLYITGKAYLKSGKFVTWSSPQK